MKNSFKLLSVFSTNLTPALNATSVTCEYQKKIKAKNRSTIVKLTTFLNAKFFDNISIPTKAPSMIKKKIYVVE
jgi:hypothetical protein